MNSPLVINAPGDWLYNEGNGNFWTVCGPSSQLQADGRSGSGLGTGSWTNTSSADIYGMRDVTANEASNISNFNTYAVFIK
jgi:hypothetical protein